MPHTTQDWLLAHPRVDYVVPFTFVLAAYLAVGVYGLAVASSTAVSIGVGSSAIAALAMASSVFICTLTYQSTHPKIVSARRHHGRITRMNWIAIIGATFTSALLPIVSLFFLEVSSFVVVLASAFALGLVTARFMRSVLWLSLTLFASDQPQDTDSTERRVLRPTA